MGRALIHLAPRRGFRSNRLLERSQQGHAETGMASSGITALDSTLHACGARSWPEFLVLGGQNVKKPQHGRTGAAGPPQGRGKWRRLFCRPQTLESEFDAIWSCQAKVHSEVLSEPLREQIRRIIFTQRPLARRPCEDVHPASGGPAACCQSSPREAALSI